VCRFCSGDISIYKEIVKAQPLLAIDFAGHKIQIEHQISIKIEHLEFTYSLCGVVYYGNNHFTARIILHDGSIWFHDGITTGQTTIYMGSLTLNCPDLNICRGKDASPALYSLN
ncbi:hypothetical protein M413DRAFT_62862, partial [Hebeloma cylindrosporum]